MSQDVTNDCASYGGGQEKAGEIPPIPRQERATAETRRDERYPKISFSFGLLMIACTFLYSGVVNVGLWATGATVGQIYHHPTLASALIRSVGGVVGCLVYAVLVLLFWNTFFTRAFHVSKIRYMHAYLIMFFSYVLVTLAFKG